MILGYKCDFCSEFGVHDDIKDHERDYSFNPRVRGCWTCEHHDNSLSSSIFGDLWQCDKNNPDFHDVQDDDIACDLWEIEEKKKGK